MFKIRTTIWTGDVKENERADWVMTLCGLSRCGAAPSVNCLPSPVGELVAASLVRARPPAPVACAREVFSASFLNPAWSPATENRLKGRTHTHTNTAAASIRSLYGCHSESPLRLVAIRPRPVWSAEVGEGAEPGSAKRATRGRREMNIRCGDDKKIPRRGCCVVDIGWWFLPAVDHDFPPSLIASSNHHHHHHPLRVPDKCQ
ncbi:hypothetical protein VOLCADRAFT_95222 [Volvox carteri f. nagariensis]|uniref:Uncharacterized protein n=1 Tax=Volvox carteri f. nagariensis TaxID=3068 RepID=D8U6X8_VOLCA|nr:uncharacterized protein VOLCADRAFT_95222 [Volvox carteri f. nagariensis]EFJ44515.1 hypothetical protein VOLCADRAFT_95222 [Volvox carteri f. nagariensis]|eukprot:XP_002954365.1 hypothetical protein VOLCADRAFT_95222 [Volvox carteri f. nagariensis]